MPGNTGLAGQIDSYLKSYGSPLAGQGATFVAAGRKYGVDPRLPVGISIAESSGGKNILGSYNAWGWGPGRPFANWEEGIATVTKGLRDGYISQGLTTPARIAGKYAPASDGNDPSHWSETVGNVMRQLGASPSTATSIQATTRPAPLPLPSSKLPSSSSLDPQLLAQLQQPSLMGVGNALISNLGQIAQTGHLSGTSGLGALSQGAMYDETMDESNQALLSQLQAQQQPPASPQAAPAPAGNKPPPSPGQSYNTSAGQPIPKNLLTSISGEHETMGLPGYPAHDYFAPAGTPAVAPVDGTVSRLSGHPPGEGPTEGPHGPFGWSVYISGDNGHSYYLTHLGSRTVSVGEQVKLGEPIGTVGDYARYGTPSHIHMGIH